MTILQITNPMGIVMKDGFFVRVIKHSTVCGATMLAAYFCGMVAELIVGKSQLFPFAMFVAGIIFTDWFVKYNKRQHELGRIR